ncbi:hypothetical protein J6590_103503 [Homalodisca vitripennis]|nr:hypothetical protein J6590_103503 [Homalodisca vitripennis]
MSKVSKIVMWVVKSQIDRQPVMRRNAFSSVCRQTLQRPHRSSGYRTAPSREHKNRYKDATKKCSAQSSSKLRKEMCRAIGKKALWGLRQNDGISKRTVYVIHAQRKKYFAPLNP